MITRALGDLEVSPLGLGCMGMTLAYGRPDQASARRTIDAAIDAGVTLFDTADMYGNGANETFVGGALAARRGRVRIATKCGITTWPVVGMPRGLDARPERILRCADASLRRLRTDVIDLYYLHRPDPKVPIEESMGAMAHLVTEGKVRAVGLSEADAGTIRRAAAVHPIAALQTEWSLFERGIEDGPLAAAREVGAGVVPYAPLGRGMLTGDPSAATDLPLLDFRRFLPRWRRANIAAALEGVEVVRRVAAGHGATPGQVALAWLLSRGRTSCPSPAPRSPIVWPRTSRRSTWT
ncbi:aldo/keto reductase [Mobilicoccus caccae]|uniref:Aldo/keto reductase n=1 Tax=Mobilicoccus caccae TaxID=1859295 RepID=A0ABQ6IMI3_9MICO|nr:aldo/keto reductase [Mobilicoccus caccae]